jgi:Homing endonuclease associated repeat
VDLFNEGVDIPCVDLVLFLRPTESMTVFLQQLGRGLRLHPGKSRLTVIDLIGNHRKAQFKLPFLIGIEDDDPEVVRKALPTVRALQEGQRPADLPDGVQIELQDKALDNLEKALRDSTGLKTQLQQAFQDLQQTLGRRPSLGELEIRGRFGANKYLRSYGSWLKALVALDAATEEERALQKHCGEFLEELEKTTLNRSYKLVVLQALLDISGLGSGVTLDALIAHFRRHFTDPRFRDDVQGTEIADTANVVRETLGKYIVRNPINAWIGGNTQSPSRYFAYDAQRSEFRYIGPQSPTTTALVHAVQERLDYLQLRYQHRSTAHERLYKVIPHGNGACIMLGSDLADGLPRASGWQLVRIAGQYRYAKFAKVAINVIADSPEDGAPNVIVPMLKQLFADEQLLDFRRAYRLRIYRSAEEGAWCVEAV